MNIRSSGGNIKLKMCRKVEIFDKCMVLGVVVPQIVPQMMQFKKFHQYQIDMNAFGSGNLSSIHLVFRHLCINRSESSICTDFQLHFHGLKHHQEYQRAGLGGPARCQVNLFHIRKLGYYCILLN